MFLKCIIPYISKDVSTSGVTTKEEAILKAQHIDLIYAQAGILYDIITDAPMSNKIFVKPNLGLHSNGIVFS